MALKPVLADISGLPEEVRREYTKRASDNMFVLQLDGTVPGLIPESEVAEHKNKLIEFRDNNRKLLAALNTDSVDTAVERLKVLSGIDPARLARLKDIDPDKYVELQRKVAALETAGVGDTKDVQKLVSDAIKQYSAEVLDPIKNDLKAERELREKAQHERDDEKFNTTISDAVGKAKAKPNAVDFLRAEARKAFEVKDGKVTARQGQFSKNKPGDPLPVEEWVATATREFDYAFESSNGSGSRGGGPTTEVQGQTLVIPEGEQADPAVLGRNAAAIASGKMKIVTTGGQR